MSDEDRHNHDPDDIDQPNGWAILHVFDRDDGEPGGYLHGPFPPGTDMLALLATVECACTKTIIAVFIPDGITMMVEAEAEDVAKAAIAAAAALIRQPKTERLN